MIPGRFTRQSLALVAAGLFAALAVQASALAATPTTNDGRPTAVKEYVKATPACSTPSEDGIRCFAMTLDRVSSLTPGARAVKVRPASDYIGPAGGYTPKALAKAYRIDRSRATNLTVGIVDACLHPNVRKDLAKFDAYYGLPAEDGTSFKIIQAKRNPSATMCTDAGWQLEIDLDVQAVRGICPACRIVLVEADQATWPRMAAAEDAAIAAGASIVSNSWGGSEGGTANPLAPHFNRPNKVIVASTGDHGMYDWDFGTSSNAPQEPASFNTVVSVGGTNLKLNADGTRKSETVWNANGPGAINGFGNGAAGGGCSTLYAARGWQSHVNKWATTACGSKRLSADIAAVADPATGLDIVHFGSWSKVGGTSLSSPLIAGMWALAGGSGGVAYPSLSLYGHGRSDVPRTFHDITSGGNGYCGGLSPDDCNPSGPAPNTRGKGILDCAWVGKTATLSAGTRACTALPGFDGPTGVGTPAGLKGFTPMNPVARITKPSTITHGHAAAFSAATSTDPFPGGKITSYLWTFGDGATSTQATVSHTYGAAGQKTLTLKVGDNYGRSRTVSVQITVQ